jgi:hypothetical protein
MQILYKTCLFLQIPVTFIPVNVYQNMLSNVGLKLTLYLLKQTVDVVSIMTEPLNKKQRRNQRNIFKILLYMKRERFFKYDNFNCTDQTVMES